MIHLLPKTQKSQHSPPQYFDIPSPSSSKISPIRIVYKKVQNDKKMRTRLGVNGYKSFSKLSACGEDTSLTLGNFIKSRNIKYIRKFEFDPYLCEKSHIKLLGKAITKLKGIQDFNLVLRRLDYMNESNLLEPVIARMNKLTRFRLELNRLENLHDEGFIALARAFGRLYSLRECEQNFVGMDHLSNYANIHFALYGSKLRLCKKCKKLMQRGALGTKNDKSRQVIQEKIIGKLKWINNCKEISLSVSTTQGWLSMSTDVDESAAKHMRMISHQRSLEKLNLYWTGNPIALETIQELAAGFPNFQHLRSFGLEFLNSRLSETEVVLFAQALPQLKVLERLQFKVIQYPNVSEGCVFYLMSIISKLANIKHFDIYFRRFDTSDEMVQELINRIKLLGNIHCELSKQSLYFYRRDEGSSK